MNFDNLMLVPEREGLLGELDQMLQKDRNEAVRGMLQVLAEIGVIKTVWAERDVPHDFIRRAKDQKELDRYTKLQCARAISDGLLESGCLSFSNQNVESKRSQRTTAIARLVRP